MLHAFYSQTPFTAMRRATSRLRSTISLIALGIIGLLAFSPTAQAQTYPERIIHNFNGGSTDGEYPIASLIALNGKLYGTTQDGGASFGTVFGIHPDGTGCQVLHSFTGGSDGLFPSVSLIALNGKLYGTTENGGIDGYGTIYGINPDGTGYQILHSFTGGSDGGFPSASLIDLNGKLYGTTSEGGANNDGTVFAINSDGTGYKTLYSFGEITDDGRNVSGLIAVGGRLYGTSEFGGTTGDGTIFSINPDGTAYQILYTFTDANGDGTNPEASLIAVNSKLYGTTDLGGATNNGVVFAINPDGTGYKTLYSFTGSRSGPNLQASLISLNGKLYGTMSGGGSNGEGAIYSVDPATNLETTLYSFQTNSSTDGVDPQSSLVNVNGVLYGTTEKGGTDLGGTIFSLLVGIAPVAQNDTARTYYNTALVIAAPGVLGNDNNGGITTTAALVTKPTHGILTFNSNGSFTYTPTAGFIGTDSFTYQAVNNIGKSNVATCTLNVQARTPIAVNNSNNVKYQTPFSVPAPGVLGNDSNGGSSPMTAVLVSNVTHGTLTLSSNGAFTYTPAAGFVGTDSFTYQAVNSVGKSNIATAALIVQAIAPTANNDAGRCTHNTTLTITAPGVLGNDSTGGNPVTASLVTKPSHGTITFNSDGSFKYTPTIGFIGTDSFTYKDTNAIGTSNTATCTITVQ